MLNALDNIEMLHTDMSKLTVYSNVKIYVIKSITFNGCHLKVNILSGPLKITNQ